ncbi:peptidylprolyl isomerase [Intestinibacillus massiliensis]|uniref:peptidylprolyl isomerase n=1 Tax=Intestinibacillus massiliensis TaxID=1871029 RepID=UPI000B3625BB|nr:peptidylprolyl isomerase [Intestinibacillus massiliensis]
MKKKLIPIIAMVLIAVICIGIVLAMHPAPKFKVTDPGTPVVMTVNGEEIHAKEYASMMVYSKAYMDNMMTMYGMGTEIWDDPEMSASLFAQLQDQTKQQVVYIHTIVDQFNKAGLKLGRDKVNAMEEQKAQVVEQQGGKTMFGIWLATLGFDEEMYDNILLVSSYVEALNDYYFGENGKALPPRDELLKAFNENYIQVKHVLISTVDDQGNALTGDALAEKTALAEDVLAQAKAGEDFDSLIKTYGEDPGMTQSPEGYIMDKDGNTLTGTMIEEFNKGSWALEVNGVSDLVKTSYGYHIIKRVPLDETKLDDYAAAVASIVKGEDVSFNAMVDQWMAEAQVETTEDFDKINLDNVFDYILPGDGGDQAGTAPAGGASSTDAGPADGQGESNPDAGQAAS